MIEVELAKKFRTLAKDDGWFVISMVGSFYGMNGLPDALFIRDGRCVFVEFKGPTTKLRELQQQVIGKLRAHGAIVYTVRFYNDSFLVNEEIILENEPFKTLARRVLEGWIENGK